MIIIWNFHWRIVVILLQIDANLCQVISEMPFPWLWSIQKLQLPCQFEFNLISYLILKYSNCVCSNSSRALAHLSSNSMFVVWIRSIDSVEILVPFYVASTSAVFSTKYLRLCQVFPIWWPAGCKEVKSNETGDGRCICGRWWWCYASCWVWRDCNSSWGEKCIIPWFNTQEVCRVYDMRIFTVICIFGVSKHGQVHEKNASIYQSWLFWSNT